MQVITNTTNATTGFDAIQSGEHDSWRAHRAVCQKIPAEEAGYRGCFALGAFTDNAASGGWISIGDKAMLIPDRDFHWVTLVDLPRSRWRAANGREVHLLSVLRTTVKFGMPTICPAGVEAYYDFRRMPFSTVLRDGSKVEAGDSLHADTLNSDDNPHLFRVGNLLNWASTSTAVHYRSTWAGARKAYYKAQNIEFTPDAVNLMFGEARWDHIERPFAWMPRAYLGFPATTVESLWDRSTKPGLLSGQRVFTDTFKLAFIADMDAGLPVIAPCDGRVKAVRRGVHFNGMPCLRVVLATDEGDTEIPLFRNANIRVALNQPVQCGDVLAHDGPTLPSEWSGFSLYKKWETAIPKLLGRQNLDNCLHLWFSRQLVRIESGFVHAPAAVASLAALSGAADDRLWWDVRASLDYYNSAADAFIFPTVKMGGWDDFRASLAGDIEYDLTPTDSNFIPRSNMNGKKNPKDDGKKTSPKADPKKGNGKKGNDKKGNDKKKGK